MRRYGWSAKLSLSILTDLDEFAVYDCRVKQATTDKVSHSRILYLKYTDYADRWEDITGIFSRDAILNQIWDQKWGRIYFSIVGFTKRGFDR